MASSILRAPHLGTIAFTATVVGGAVAAASYIWLKRKAAASNFVPVARLVNITIYPIKSLAGIEVPYADCTVAGPVYKGLKDRQMLLVKDDYFVSMREEPRLGMISVVFDENKLMLTLTVNGYPPLVVHLHDSDEQSVPSFTVRVRKNSYKAVEVSEEASRWFRNFLNCDSIRLVRIVLDKETIDRGRDGSASVAFQDKSSFQVLSKASLDELVSRLPPGSNIRQRNFRPSLFVEGCKAHSEDHWLRYRIGEAEMAFLERTRRCVMTTVDQDTGIKTGKEPLVTLRKYRVDRSKLGLERYESHPLLGIGSIHIKDGRIAPGDEICAIIAPNPLL
ncbi:mitochondrial amidoxime reducing component 2-like [Dermacentor andersoni]|uniref:mitochondrial amidoxime reducing component 2-like n=1 Tax=Dermacentor andersoni TaxID=34620 RepID=UPI003B3A9778